MINKSKLFVSALGVMFAMTMGQNVAAQNFPPMGGAPGMAPAAGAQARPAQPGQGAPQMGMGMRQPVTFEKTDITPYFTASTAKPATPDKEGFIRRWTLLEPITKPNRSNTVFTDSYIRTEFAKPYFQNQMTILPKNGDKVTVDGKELVWHALDSKLYNVKLFRFATSLENAERYGILFWAVTVVNCTEDIENVRMAVGSNSASMWWLNGEEAVILSGDRRMVADDAVSKRITLKKGKNVIRGAVINGPGMSDFCLRFIDEKGEPVKNITITNE